jgi:hypothetical protein
VSSSSRRGGEGPGRGRYYCIVRRPGRLAMPRGPCPDARVRLPPGRVSTIHDAATSSRLLCSSNVSCLVWRGRPSLWTKVASSSFSIFLAYNLPHRPGHHRPASRPPQLLPPPPWPRPRSNSVNHPRPASLLSATTSPTA